MTLFGPSIDPFRRASGCATCYAKDEGQWIERQRPVFGYFYVFFCMLTHLYHIRFKVVFIISPPPFICLFFHFQNWYFNLTLFSKEFMNLFNLNSQILQYPITEHIFILNMNWTSYLVKVLDFYYKKVDRLLNLTKKNNHC